MCSSLRPIARVALFLSLEHGLADGTALRPRARTAQDDRPGGRPESRPRMKKLVAKLLELSLQTGDSLDVTAALAGLR